MSKKYRNLSNATFFSLGTLVLFTSYNSSLNIQSQVMIDDGFGDLGFYSIAVLYLCTAFGSLFSTAIMNKLGWKACFFIGGLTLTLWSFVSIFAAMRGDGSCSSQFYCSVSFVDFIILFVSVINGFGNALYWVA